MSELIRVPDIGSGEGEVIELFVKVGDTVEADQSILTLESDKASMEIPAPKAGVVKSLKVKLNNRVLQDSYVISDIGALAVKDLKEKVVGTLTTQVIRATAKYAAQKELGNQFGVLGQLAGNVLNMATERADLRAWTTLPSNTQIARLNLTPGTHNLQLSSGNLSSSSVKLDVKANETVFVYAHHVNDKITASVSSIPRQ